MVYQSLLSYRHDDFLSFEAFDLCPLWRIVHAIEDEMATEYVKAFISACEMTGCGRCIKVNPHLFHGCLVEAARRGLQNLTLILLPYASSLSQVLSAAIRSKNEVIIQSVLTRGPDLSCAPHLIELHSEYIIQYEDIEGRSGLTIPLAEAIRAKNPKLINLTENRGALTNLGQDGRFGIVLAAALEVGDAAYTSKLLKMFPTETGAENL